MLQTNLEDFITLPPMIRLINRKITLVFDYFAYIGKNASQLFCTSDIENIDKAIEIYEHFSKKIPLEWPICTSADIMRTLSKLKVNLEKFKKYLLSTFYLLTKFYLGKGLEEKSMEPLLIKNIKKDHQNQNKTTKTLKVLAECKCECQHETESESKLENNSDADIQFAKTKAPDTSAKAKDVVFIKRTPLHPREGLKR